ncbi:flagellar associated protein [Toxoplasma gondii CAST]|uniref:Flagellar associated protein n=1 Tax=Toxoplasma gondii CAST TaxID=943122 RepID=A0A3R7YQM4_TOXGO|nr:flagellar associated protein [Toxoplasma gondii CAST]
MEEDATVTQEEPEVFTSSDRGGSVGGSEGESNIREIPSYPLENGEQIRDEHLETDAGQETCVAVWASPEDGSLGPAAYVALEETFDQTLKDLPDDPSLDAFRRQYEQLLSALKRSHESELSLLARCKTLTSQISENATKVTAALKLSDEDQSSIDILKKEVQHAWHLVQAGKDREELARETIYSLRKTIEDLNRQIEATETEHITQEAKLEEYLQEREKLLRGTYKLRTSSEIRRTTSKRGNVQHTKRRGYSSIQQSHFTEDKTSFVLRYC